MNKYEQGTIFHFTCKNETFINTIANTMEWSVIQKEKNIDGELIYRLLAWSQFDNGDLVSKFGPVLKNFKGQGRIQALSHYFDTDYISRIDIKVKPSCWDINDIRKLYIIYLIHCLF